MEKDADGTRTTLDSDGITVLWSPGDAISVFYGSGDNGGGKFTSSATENSKTAEFSGSIDGVSEEDLQNSNGTYFWGVYPYSEEISCDGNYITLTLSAEHTATAGTFATGTFPLIGRSQDLFMKFYNVCGGWRFSVTKEGVRKVTLKSNNGELITGKAKIGIDGDGHPYVSEILDASDEIVLECPVGEYFEVGKNYYMAMFPTTFTDGFTMTFETLTEKGIYERRINYTSVKRRNFLGIKDIDNYLTSGYSRQTGNIPIEDANFKAYLVENFDTDGDGEISYEEANEILDINVDTDNIESIQGIEYMENLTGLVCRGSGRSYSYESGSFKGNGSIDVPGRIK